MAWTYTPTLPTGKDQVRLLVGDTDITDQQLSDEEISAMITAYSSTQSAAIAAARALAAKYARFADKWVGDLKILASQKSDMYLKLANELEESSTVMGSSGGVLSAGGIYVAQKEIAAADEALVQPFFRRGMHDNECEEY